MFGAVRKNSPRALALVLCSVCVCLCVSVLCCARAMGDAWQSLLAAAATEQTGLPPALLLPWEVGYAGLVLARGSGVGRAMSGALYQPPAPLHPPPLPPAPLPPTISTTSRRETQPLKRRLAPPRFAAQTHFGRTKRQRPEVPPVAADASARAKVLDVWMSILARVDGATVATDGGDDDGGDPRRSVELAFTKRATSTLAKRGAAVLSYIRWFHGMDLPGLPLPVKEPVLFRYLLELLDAGAAPTKASGVLEGLNLAAAVLGFPSEAHHSQRVKGCAEASMSRKHATIQRPPFTVAVVKVFEDGVFRAGSLADRIFSGFLAFTIHARLRFLDAARISVEPRLVGDEADGYIESHCSVHKGSNSKRARGLVLPAVGHATGLTGEAWAAEWLRLRRDAGMNAAADQCLMRAPLADGTFASSRIATADGITWMREVLADAGVSLEEAAAYGTHSCKATLLSWAAKAGLEKSDRRLLGGHAAQKDRSVLEYSRDALSSPLHKLGLLLDRIALGDFVPDAARSGRWKGFAAQRAKRSVEEVEADSDGTGGTSSSELGASSSSDDNLTRSVSAVVAAEAAASGLASPPSTTTDEESSDEVPAEDMPEGGLVQHVRYRTLHVLSVVGGGRKMLCGREMTEQYKQLEEWPAASWHRCSGCFQV